MRKFLSFTAISAAALAASSPAFAGPVLFNITGPNAISFTVDQSPTPDFSSTSFFALYSVLTTVNGVTSSGEIDFDPGGSFKVAGYTFGASVDLFSGTTTSPTFLIGNYTLEGFHPDATGYSLSISQVAAVPEPATWTMLLVGFGAIGFAIRRRRQNEVTFRRAA